MHISVCTRVQYASVHVHVLQTQAMYFALLPEYTYPVPVMIYMSVIMCTAACFISMHECSSACAEGSGCLLIYHQRLSRSQMSQPPHYYDTGLLRFHQLDLSKSPVNMYFPVQITYSVGIPGTVPTAGGTGATYWSLDFLGPFHMHHRHSGPTCRL